jgi:hypothetical protein
MSGRTRLVSDRARPGHVSLLLAVFALLVLVPTASAASAEPDPAIVILDNRISVDGAKADPGLDPVLVTHAGTTYAIRPSSPETADAIRKMKPEAALKAVVVFNRELQPRIQLGRE